MVVKFKNIYKSFGQNRVLKDINFSIGEGEIVALAGENGAGKSTLMKILSGALNADSGEIIFNGRHVSFNNTFEAMNIGIQMIYQELNLIPDLSVAENLYLVDEKRQFGRFISQKKTMAIKASEFMKELGVFINPNIPVYKLSIAEQQMVEISKSLSKNIQILIMDEPTAALNDSEKEQLFKQISKLKKRGVAVIYISHRLEEVFKIADKIVVLRNGTVVLNESIDDINHDKIVTSMVGQQVEDFYPKEKHVNYENVELSVNGLTNENLFYDINFNLYRGEVLGISGLMGSGKGEIIRSLFGDLKIDAGEVIMENSKITIRSPKEAINHGIVYLTSDRKEEGLIMDMSVSKNISIASLSKFVKKTGIINTKIENKETKQFIDTMKVKTTSASSPVNQLSGGNQQKVVFGKWLMTNPKIFIMEEPTRGVDVGAKSEIYKLINNLTEQGISIILVSSDIPEVVAMSDRIIILKDGKIAKKLKEKEISQHNVLHYALKEEIS